tara:strand:+ start:92 stop:322 length:231 start_codon:yes stop_codon:yes gene_type:complete
MTTHEAPRTAYKPLAMSYNDAAAYVGLSRRTIIKLVSTGEFPRPRKVRGTTALRFSTADVEAWFDNQPEQNPEAVE